MSTSAVIPAGIEQHIVTLRKQRVMLDADLARLYGTETRVLVQAVKRNIERFPADFMFQLNAREVAALTSQVVMSNEGMPPRGGRRTATGSDQRRSSTTRPRPFGLSLLRILANQEQFFGRKGREEERKGRKEGGQAFSPFATFASALRVLCVLPSSTHLRSDVSVHSV